MICPICKQKLYKNPYFSTPLIDSWICSRDHFTIDICNSTNQCIYYFLRFNQKQLAGDKNRNYSWLFDITSDSYQINSSFIPLSIDTLLSKPHLLFNRLLKLKSFL